MPTFCVLVVTVINPELPLNCLTERDEENDMGKWIGLLVFILFLGDPGLSFLNLAGEFKELIIVMTIGLLAAPWVVSQMDN